MLPTGGWNEFLNALEKRVPFGLGPFLASTLVVTAALGGIGYGGHLAWQYLVRPFLPFFHLSGRLPDTYTSQYVSAAISYIAMIGALGMAVRWIVAARAHIQAINETAATIRGVSEKQGESIPKLEQMLAQVEEINREQRKRLGPLSTEAPDSDSSGPVSLPPSKPDQSRQQP